MPIDQTNIFYGHKEPDGKSFVGIRVENGVPKIFFPVGYRKANDDNELRRDVLNMTSILSLFYKKKKDDFSRSYKLESNFPLQAYIGVYSYFLNFGYYVETKKSCKQTNNGKINWNKTIQNVQPQFSNGNPFYLNFFRQTKESNFKSIVTQIHKYCLNKSFEKIGHLFDLPQSDKSEISFNKNLFLAVLNTKVANTFNENQICLFKDMIDIVNNEGGIDSSQNLFYGTYEFDYVWEKLIDEEYGIDDVESYYPHYKYLKKSENGWNLLSERPLKPDTIMLHHDKAYILDAKYYSYSKTQNPSDLPGSESVNKQMSYAHYIEHNYHYPIDKIFNAFILPYDCGYDDTNMQTKKELLLETNWEDEDKSYRLIHTIYLDIKNLMYRHSRKSEPDIIQLARQIELI